MNKRLMKFMFPHIADFWFLNTHFPNILIIKKAAPNIKIIAERLFPISIVIFFLCNFIINLRSNKSTDEHDRCEIPVKP